MSKEKVLLINDLAGYGKVALSAMIPVLSHMQSCSAQRMPATYFIPFFIYFYLTFLRIMIKTAVSSCYCCFYL